MVFASPPSTVIVAAEPALNEGTVTLERTEQTVPATVHHADRTVVPYHAGETLGWRLK